jgi:hypothetical protein
VGMRSTEAETAVNVAKLQYCASITDVDHDYMVVDVFTDSTGYNNTILLPSYSSSMISTGICCTGIVGTACTAISFGYNDTLVCSDSSTLSCLNDYTFCLCRCMDCFTCPFGCINAFYYNICRCCQVSTVGSPTVIWIQCFENSHDNSYLCLTAGVNTSSLTCYCYNNLSGSTWCFYCNGVGVCCVTLTDYPKITFSTFACIKCCANVRTMICFRDIGVCLKNSTSSTYCSSALNGYYLNGGLITTSPTVCVISSSTSGGCVCTTNGNYFISAIKFSAAGVTGGASIKSCINAYTYSDINNIICFSYRITCYAWSCSFNGSAHTFTMCYSVENSIDNSNYCCSYSRGSPDASFSCNWVNTTNCYCFLRISPCCYNYYKNGLCICSLTLTALPNPIFCSSIPLVSNGGAYGNTNVCLHTFSLSYIDGNTKVSTIPIEYSQPAQTSYLSTDHTGAGTIAYNVYDAATDCQIGTNLLPNTLNTLTDCVQCHYYEIIQCSDGVSCIKSYAILAGVY